MARSVNTFKLSVFISYDTASGLEYARESKRIFEEAGCKVWMWDDDSMPGAFLNVEIAENIELCDIFFYLCTTQDQPERVNGQPYERSLAWRHNKYPLIVTFDSIFVPRDMLGQRFEVVSPATFADKCQEIVNRIVNSPMLEKRAGYFGEAEQLDSTG